MLNIPQVPYIEDDEGGTGATCCVASTRAACTAVVTVRPRFLLADTMADVVPASSVTSERRVPPES